MLTIYKADEGRISVADAKRLIVDASPKEAMVDIYIRVDEQGTPVPGAHFEARESSVARHALMIDRDFPATMAELGIEPRLTWRLPIKGYRGAEDDEWYVISHDEFVSLAKHHDLLVAVGEPRAEKMSEEESVLQPIQRSRAQESAMLAALRDAGFDPGALPPAQPGKASAAKEAARAKLTAMSSAVFNKTWQRLRSDDQIRDAKP